MRIIDLSQGIIDPNVVGGKGASLAQLLLFGIPVPPGFVITTQVFEECVKSKTISDTLRDEIFYAFERLGSPEFVAVRSSATAEDSANASWAGELETYLNTTKVQLITNIQRCWASLSSPRAVVYAKHHNVDTLSMAVVVQQMIQSDVAGVAFTVHPVTQNRNHIIIEAGLGLGEAIVSGSITPDSYVVDKSSGHIVEVIVNEQERKLVKKIEFDESNTDTANEWVDIAPDHRSVQKLSLDQIQQLATLCMTIEQRYGFPCDIEWALLRSSSSPLRQGYGVQAEGQAQFYITQSRPITTLASAL